MESSDQISVSFDLFEQEVRKWAEFTAIRGFGARPGPVARFFSRFVCDPTGRRDFIAVARKLGDIVGGIRVFDRHAHCGKSLRMFGIGEVCSDPELRGKGIAAMLLQAVVALMEAQQEPAVCFLHAAAGVQGLYAKYGFQPVSMPYGRVSLVQSSAGGGVTGHTLGDQSAGAGSSFDSALTVEKADLARQWPELSSLYESTCRRLGLCGWVVRDEEYWRSWVPGAASTWAGSESFETAMDAEIRAREQADKQRLHVARCSSCSRILAYACVQVKWEQYRLTDWGCLPFEAHHTAGGRVAGTSSEHSSTSCSCTSQWTGPAALSFLARVACTSVGMDGKTVWPANTSGQQGTASGSVAHVCVPTPILQEIVGACDGSAGRGQPRPEQQIASESRHGTVVVAGTDVVLQDPAMADEGWMVRAIRPQGSAAVVQDEDAGAAGLAHLLDSASRGTFAIYGLDAF